MLLVNNNYDRRLLKKISSRCLSRKQSKGYRKSTKSTKRLAYYSSRQINYQCFLHMEKLELYK